MSKTPVRSQNLRRPVFENRFDLAGELIGQCAIDQAMVEGQRQISHRSNSNRVVNHYRLFLHSSNAENRYLRLIDDGRGEDTAEAAEICNRECPTLHFV